MNILKDFVSILFTDQLTSLPLSSVSREGEIFYFFYLHRKWQDIFKNVRNSSCKLFVSFVRFNLNQTGFTDLLNSHQCNILR